MRSPHHATPPATSGTDETQARSKSRSLMPPGSTITSAIRAMTAAAAAANRPEPSRRHASRAAGAATIHHGPIASTRDQRFPRLNPSSAPAAAPGTPEARA
jgi:hypothetical protein